jgi:hypothetical protein
VNNHDDEHGREIRQDQHLGDFTVAGAGLTGCWYHQGGTVCTDGHYVSSMLCAAGGGLVTRRDPQSGAVFPLTPAEHVARAAVQLSKIETELADGAPAGPLERAVIALAHGITALAASEFAEPGRTQENLPRGTDYGSAWNGLLRWAQRELALLEASTVRNPAQEREIRAVLHRMGRAESGDPRAFSISLTGESANEGGSAEAAGGSSSGLPLRDRILAATTEHHGQGISAAGLALVLRMPGPAITAELEQMAKDGLAMNGDGRSAGADLWFLTPARPQGAASLRENISFWLAGTRNPHGWTLRWLSAQTGRPDSEVLAELERMEDQGFAVRQTRHGSAKVTWALA